VSSAPESRESRPLVLYRCRTPTNVLCPCGAVARRLRKLGIEYETHRVPYRRADRPEIVELTGQNRVPVLIEGDDVIHDSKRILEHLEHEHGEGAGSGGPPAREEGSR
jgi:glutathione S-transferase